MKLFKPGSGQDAGPVRGRSSGEFPDSVDSGRKAETQIEK